LTRNRQKRTGFPIIPSSGRSEGHPKLWLEDYSGVFSRVNKICDVDLAGGDARREEDSWPSSIAFNPTGLHKGPGFPRLPWLSECPMTRAGHDASFGPFDTAGVFL
jgi:hypothetical protein